MRSPRMGDWVDVMRRGEKAEKNVTAIPRQAGYLETYYKDDEEVAQARGMSTSVGTLPILQEAHYNRLASSFVVGCAWRE